MSWPKRVRLKEVGPRDGLQNEKTIVSIEDKIQFINLLSHSGLDYIEITSFVHPKWIPQLADALEVAKGITRVSGVTYAALVPNLKGLERAIEANIDEISVFMSASESHNLKNINKSIAATFPVLKNVVEESLVVGKSVRAYISMVFGCPYEGKVPMDSVIRVVDKLIEMGVSELSLGDTIGIANPKQVQEVIEILLKRFSSRQLALHFHDTRGLALANILASLEMGMSTFDSSVGGIGGCPYAKGASGNVATEDLQYMLDGMSIQTGINQNELVKAAEFIQTTIGSHLPSHTLQATKTIK
jgi:hydroxymethylglutaryl-CoA lyase